MSMICDGSQWKLSQIETGWTAKCSNHKKNEPGLIGMICDGFQWNPSQIKGVY